jgi:hypothetical protein
MLTQRDIQILKFVREYGAITINQAHKLYFNSRYGKDLARKRLKKLCDMGELQSGTLDNSISNHRMYFKDKIINTQKMLVLDLYSNLISNGVKVLELSTEVNLGDNSPSGFIKARYKEIEKEMFVEIEITDRINYESYEHLKDCYVTNELHNKFPSIIAVSENYTRYCGEKLDVMYLNYKLNNFIEVIFS